MYGPLAIRVEESYLCGIFGTLGRTGFMESQGWALAV
jgi:hypothetical protein